MARQRGPARAAPRTQARQASTATMPTRTAPPPAPPAVQHAQPPAPVTAGAQAQGPGLFGQMASTAAGVAVGSTVGHVLGAGITGLFGGSGEPAPAQAEAPPAAQANSNAYGDRTGMNCDADAKAFTKCMDEHQGNMTICNWYLEQLKACQNMAKQY